MGQGCSPGVDRCQALICTDEKNATEGKKQEIVDSVKKKHPMYAHCKEPDFVPDDELAKACEPCGKAPDEGFVQCVEDQFPAPPEGEPAAANADGAAVTADAADAPAGGASGAPSGA